MAIVNNTSITSPFSFSFPAKTDRIFSSIKQFGQLSPVIISEVNGVRCVIDGYRRLEILKEFSISPYFYELPKLSLNKALNLYIEINLFSRKFNSVEKVRISHFIMSNNISIAKELISKAELGDISANSRLYEFTEGLGESDKILITEKQLTPVLLQRLYKIGKKTDITPVLKIIRERELTHQQSREIISDLYILAMRGEDIQKIIKGVSEQGYEDIRQRLRKITNPVLTKMEESIKVFSGRFKNISLSPPQNFEGDRYSINTSFTSECDLDRIIDDIRRLKEEWKDNPVLK